MVRPPQRSRGVSFRDQLSELIAEHSADIGAADVSQSLQELSRALDDDDPPSLSEPTSSFERKLNDLVQRHADLADNWSRLTRTLSDLADDLDLGANDESTLTADATYRRTDGGHLLTVSYPAPFLLLRAVDTLAEVGGLVVEGRMSIPILSAVDLRVTCDGIDESVEVEAQVVQQDDDALSLDIDLTTQADAIDRLRTLARGATPDERDPEPSDGVGDASSQPVPPGSRHPQTPGTTANPFDDSPDDDDRRQPPAGHSPEAAVLRPADAPSTSPSDKLGVGDGDRKTRRGRRLLDALSALHTRTQADNLFAVLGLDWTANGANVREAHHETVELITQINDLPLTNRERQHLREIQRRVQRAAKILRHSGSRREYRASQIDTDKFVAHLTELETRLAARVLREDDPGARRICAQLLELDPSHPNAHHHKQRLD